MGGGIMSPNEIEKIIKQIWEQQSKNKPEIFYPKKYNKDKKLLLQLQNIKKENK